MAYRIEIKPQAEKALLRIPTPHRARIAAAIDGLTRLPRPPGCIKMTGADNAYRVRVGDYRIVYQVHDRVLIVYIVSVAHRKDVYRDL